MTPLALALAVSLTQADGGPPRWPEPIADGDFAPGAPELGLLTVWTDDRRGQRWKAPRGGDLWINGLSVDGGPRLGPTYGQLLCRGVEGEVLSSARIAAGDGGAYVAWKVAWDGGSGIRASWLSWAGGTPTFGPCDAGLVASSGDIRWVRLEESDGEFLVLWEDDSTVSGRFLSGTAPGFIIAQKDPVVPDLAPSLAATRPGFFAAWVADGGLFGVWVTDGGLFGAPMGGPAPPPGAVPLFPPEVASGPPVVSGPPLTVAWPSAAIGSAGAMVLKSGRPDPVPNFNNVLPFLPEVMPGPLVGLSLRGPTPGTDRSWVAHTGRDGGTVVSVFATQSESLSLAQPWLRPQAMALAGAQLLLLGTGETFFYVVPVPLTAGSINRLSFIDRNRALPDQVAPSATWSSAGAWVVAWNEGNAVRLTGVPPQSMPFPLSPASAPPGTLRVLSIADTDEVAVAVQGATSYLISGLDGGAVRFSAPASLPAALAGNHRAVMWAPGDGRLYSGGAPAVASDYPLGRLGRCGDWADNHLMVPLVTNGTKLQIVTVEDSPAGPAAQLHGPLVSGSVELRSPCLAADGNRLLLIATDPSGALLAWETSASDVLGDKPATSLPSPVALAGLTVVDPVAARTPRGWQLAWHSPTPSGAVVYEGSFDRGGANPRGSQVTFDTDDEREAQVVPSRGGDVLLTWRVFDAPNGNLKVKWQVLPQEPALDAGVDAGAPDAGPELDGGVDAGLDGGAEGADGGPPLAPITFRACGCDAGPALLSTLAVLLLTRRRVGPR